MPLKIWDFVTEIDEHLKTSNLTTPELVTFVGEVKKTIIEVLWSEKFIDDDSIVTNEEIIEIKEKVSELEKPVSKTINEFLFYLNLILNVEKNTEIELYPDEEEAII